MVKRWFSTGQQAVRAAVVLGAWIPAISSAADLTRFVPMFDRISERGELPVLTRWMMPLGRLGPTGAVVTMLATVALLVMIDMAAQRTKLPNWVCWGWFGVMIIGGMVVFLLCMLAILQPLWKLGAQVE